MSPIDHTGLRRYKPLRPISDGRRADLADAGLLVPGSTFARPHRKTTPAPRSTGPSEKTLRLLIDRCTRDRVPCCEGCAQPLYGSRGWSWSVQHRDPRGMGGTRRPEVNLPSRLLVLCGSATTPGSCHEFAESQRAEAEDLGWVVRMGFDPAATAVLIDHSSRLVYLGDDGRYYDNPTTRPAHRRRRGRESAVVTSRILTEEQAADRVCAAEPYLAAEAERQALVAACGGHEWEMHLEEDDFVSLLCARCPADVNDLYPDGVDLLYAEFDTGARVDAGKHDSPVPLVVPVTVEVIPSRMWTDYGWEYDVEIQVEQRGPARPVEDGVS